MKLKEIPRTAAFAWLPDATKPAVVTGTAAGTIDADFSAATRLELWKLDLLDHSAAAVTAEPSAVVDVDARFHDVAVSDDAKYVAGALENGVVGLWNARDLKELSRTDAYADAGAVRAVAWSRKDRGLLAAGGAGGSVNVWRIGSDGSGLDKPIATLGAGTTRSGRADDVTSVAWNNTATQILASASSAGFASIWDTERKREVLHLHYTSPTTGQRVPISAVQWHPTNSTKLVTASADDGEPVICVWDLKNANSPETVLRGHTKGILSLDWCRQDPGLLLSGGRDNATLLWNPVEGQLLGSYPISVEWAFKTQFHPRAPDLLATASFDGKVTVQTLQDTKSDESKSNGAGSGNGEDFWESDTVLDAVHPSFTLQQAPTWLQRPVSARFGFGGKLARVRPSEVDVLTIKDPAFDAALAPDFSEAVKSGDYAKLVSSHVGAGSKSAGYEWKLLAAVSEGKAIPLPEDKNAHSSDGDDDDFDIVAQYAPSDDYELVGDSKHPAVVSAVLAGDFDTAVSKLISAGEVGDALLVASFGGPGLIARAQNAYLNAHAPSQPHLRAAWSVAKHHVDDLVKHTELAAWPAVLRSVLTKPDAEVSNSSETDINVPAATATLGRRLAISGDRDNALKVFLAGHNVAAAGGLWLDQLPTREKELANSGSGVTAYVAHVRALQEAVEKIAIAAHSLGLPAITEPEADRVYTAFRDYADVASQQGDLDLAKAFLDLLPEEYAAEKQRVQVATQQPQQQVGGRAPRAVPGAARNVSPGVIPPLSTGTSAPTSATASPAARSARPGTHSRTGSVSRAGVPNTTKPTTSTRRYAANPYAPTGPSGASSPGSIPSSPMVPGPPPVVNAPPGTVPPREAARQGWNDIPDLPQSARRTPAAPQVIPPPRAATSGPPPAASLGPSVGPGGSRPSRAAAPPPPPKVGEKPPPAQKPAAPVTLNTPAPPMVPTPVAQAPVASPAPSAPSSAARPSNPYATRSAVRSGGGAPAKASPYTPPPGSTPSPSASMPPSRPVSRSAAPPRARAPPPPHAAGATSGVPHARNTPPPPPPPANTRPPVASPPTAALASTGITSSEAAAGGATTGATSAPDYLVPIRDGLQAELERVRPVIEAQYKKQYRDTERRLEILYKHLAAQDLLGDEAISELRKLVDALAAGDHDAANAHAAILISDHSTETGQWMTGVKRLVTMSATVPV